jgi:hypothetical protein
MLLDLPKARVFGGGNVSVAPATGDLTAWPRRGATIAQSLLDTRWDYEAWAAMLGGIFGGRGLTQVNILSAEWPDPAPHFERPFVKLPDGKFDLHQANPKFYDRLPRYVEAMNRHGVVVQLCFLELYSWSQRKTGVPDQNLSFARHNINGVRWGPGDETFDILPDAFVAELVERVVTAVKGAGVCVLPGNEFPEKPVHLKIAAIAKTIDPTIRVVTNRNEDTPGQYMNMRVGRDLIDMIAYHGWRDLSFLTREFADEPSDRPGTFAEFFNRRAQNGAVLDISFDRVICSSDGSRASNDPINTYDWAELLKVFKFVTDKGASCEHQSRSKMWAGARLDMVEESFLRDIAAL